jgi:segregation and condensation protein B
MRNALVELMENLLFAAGEPLPLARIKGVVSSHPDYQESQFEQNFSLLLDKYANAAIELKLLPSGYCMQTRAQYAPWIGQLFEEKPQKYSQATLEILAIITYDQPVTRGDIEQKRGVAVSPQILKKFLEREWIKVVGYRDSPGKPSLYATTDTFLNYFNLSSLDELPEVQVEEA